VSGLFLGLYTSPTGTLLLDASPFARGLRFSTGPHGYKDLSCSLDIAADIAARLWDFLPPEYVKVTHDGIVIWKGRLEDPTLELSDSSDGFSIRAFGYQNGYRDKSQDYSPAAYAAASPQTIVNAIIAAVNTANSFMSSNTALIDDPGLSITETYVRVTPDSILDRLAEYGDGIVRWEWGVWDDRQLHFRERGSQGFEWATDATYIKFERSLSNLFNSVRAEYQNTVTATSVDNDSVAQYGITRETTIRANTDDATLAAAARDVFLADRATTPVRATFDIPELYDTSGNRLPKFLARSGDGLRARNLSPTLSTSIDRVRWFRISETEYNADTDELTATPELPLPTVAVQLGEAP